MLTEEHSPTNKEQSLSIRSVSKQNITEKSQGKHTPVSLSLRVLPNGYDICSDSDIFID